MATVTCELDDELVSKMNRIASLTGRSESSLVGEAVRSRIDGMMRDAEFNTP